MDQSKPTTPPSKTVLLAAGGTGGHIFPAVALAEVLRKRGVDVALVTDHRFHQYSTLTPGSTLSQIPIHTIHAGSFNGGVVKKLRGVVGIFRGVVQAIKLIKRTKPIAVVGFGGYPSLPTMIAAVILSKRTIIHEQNSVLGRVNRALAAKVTRIATAYKEIRLMPPEAVEKVALVGNPVRAAVLAVADAPYPAPTEGGTLAVLVLGGSQGASVFSDAIPKAMALLPEAQRARIQLTQQCRAPELEATRAAYAALSMPVELAPFFGDVAERLAAAQFVIGRAGASTVAELTIVGRPGLLVPLPIAMDNHQYYNALAVEQTGAGWVVKQDQFTPEALAAKLMELLAAPAQLTACATAMRNLQMPNAAETLADLVLG